jgi:hypothetical protein
MRVWLCGADMRQEATAGDHAKPQEQGGDAAHLAVTSAVMLRFHAATDWKGPQKVYHRC